MNLEDQIIGKVIKVYFRNLDRKKISCFFNTNYPMIIYKVGHESTILRFDFFYLEYFLSNIAISSSCDDKLSFDLKISYWKIEITH